MQSSSDSSSASDNRDLVLEERARAGCTRNLSLGGQSEIPQHSVSYLVQSVVIEGRCCSQQRLFSHLVCSVFPHALTPVLGDIQSQAVRQPGSICSLYGGTQSRYNWVHLVQSIWGSGDVQVSLQLCPLGGIPENACTTMRVACSPDTHSQRVLLTKMEAWHIQISYVTGFR